LGHGELVLVGEQDSFSYLPVRLTHLDQSLLEGMNARWKTIPLLVKSSAGSGSLRLRGPGCTALVTRGQPEQQREILVPYPLAGGEEWGITLQSTRPPSAA
ncbi:MAG: hypothetical protein D6736_10985, partial [Nitrospinota bacterium]